MKISGAQAIIKALEIEGVDTIFGYPGATICPFYDALVDSGIRHILVRQEQCAAHAASGYARVTGKAGVCVATSGPGATNLITGIATAYMDSISIVAITGQVTSELIGRDVFQEADITGATAPFCKHSYLVKDVRDIPVTLKQAFHIATTGRPGPVLIDIPVDVQKKEIDFTYPATVDIRGYKPNYKGHSLQLKRVVDAIKKSKTPVICAGGGIISAKAGEELVRLAERYSIPVTTTLMGIGSIPADHELCLGMLGSHGVYAANHAVHNADLVLILGARVGDRAMGTAHKIAERAKIIHIDIDPAEIGKNIGTAIPVVGEVKLVLADILNIQDAGEAASGESGGTAGSTSSVGDKDAYEARKEWCSSVTKLKAKNAESRKPREGWYINPRYVLSRLSDITGGNIILATEVGQNQIWAANNFRIGRYGKFITSGGMGTMGSGLPSAIGAKFGKPGAPVVLISGDGSFQMSLQELGTIKQCRLGVKMILFNNSRLGMVRELQKIHYCGRYSQVFLEENPDFVKLAAAYDIEGQRVGSDSEVDKALDKLLSDDRPYLLEFVVDPEESTM